MLISGEAWADDCHYIKFRYEEHKATETLLKNLFFVKCEDDGITCVFDDKMKLISCFPTNSKAK